MNLTNKSNEYVKILKDYDRIPKTVLAAIAVSFALRIEEEAWERVENRVANEWQALYDNGIVPQKPTRK
jgi:hypothetical protein